MYIQVTEHQAGELDHILTQFERWSSPAEIFSKAYCETTLGWTAAERIKHIEDVESIDCLRLGKKHWSYFIPNNQQIIQDLLEDIEDMSALTTREQRSIERKLRGIKPKRKPRLVKQDTSYNEEVTKQMVADCMNCLSNPLYELGITSRNAAVAHALDSVKIYHNKKNHGGLGGSDTIQINLAKVNRNDKFPEYAAYEKDPVIGAVPETDHWDYLFLLVAHEVTHHVQYKYCVTNLWGRQGTQFAGVRNRSHGEIFQKIYRYLRRDLVNRQLGKLDMSFQEWGLTELKYE
jgi:hypothetical protein